MTTFGPSGPKQSSLPHLANGFQHVHECGLELCHSTATGDGRVAGSHEEIGQVGQQGRGNGGRAEGGAGDEVQHHLSVKQFASRVGQNREYALHCV